MKYLKTKHERNSAKITALTVLIIGLLLFVVGAPYKEIPEEYGVAINFGEPSKISDNKALDNPTKSDSNSETIEDEVSPEQEIEDEQIEEVAEEALKDVENNFEAEAKLAPEIEEQKAIEEAVKEEVAKLEAAKQEASREEAEKKKAVEELLAQEQEEALRIKEANEKAEAERLEKERQEKIESKRLSDAKAKEERDAQAERDRARKAEAERIAKAAKEKADRAAEAKAEAERLAKAKAAREAKERADRAAAAKAAEAESDRKAAAAAEKNKSGGSDVVGFALIEEAPIYPGCEGLNNDARKQCMSTKVKQFVSSNFDGDLASNLGLTGNQKITIYFKISKTGQIIDIRAKAGDPKLEEEAKRVTKMLPKLKPGIQQGKAVIVPYSIPIRFKAKQ